MKRLIQLTILGCLPLSALCNTVSDKQTAIETLNKQSTTKAIAKIQTDKNPLLKASYEISPKFISKSNIKKTLSISQLSGGGGGVIDLGGGDAIAMTPGYDSRNSNFYTLKNDINWDDINFSFRYNLFNTKKEMRLYSLDLIEIGTQYNVKINIDNDLKNSSDTLCVNNFGCYKVENNTYFQELMDYGGFFGGITTAKQSFDRKEFANSKELKDLFNILSKQRSKSLSLTIELASESMFETEETEEMKRLSLEISKIESSIKEIKENYTTAVAQAHPTVRESNYSENTILAIGVINKLEEIRKIQPTLSKLLGEELLNLEWLLVDLPLRDIADEGETAVKLDNKIQIAHRRKGVVKISSFGWDKNIELDDVSISPMDSSNKVALIFHEVVYQITKASGDETGERARDITGLIFKKNRVSRNMKKALLELKL